MRGTTCEAWDWCETALIYSDSELLRMMITKRSLR